MGNKNLFLLVLGASSLSVGLNKDVVLFAIDQIQDQDFKFFEIFFLMLYATCFYFIYRGIKFFIKIINIKENKLLKKIEKEGK